MRPPAPFPFVVGPEDRTIVEEMGYLFPPGPGVIEPFPDAKTWDSNLRELFDNPDFDAWVDGAGQVVTATANRVTAGAHAVANVANDVATVVSDAQDTVQAFGALTALAVAAYKG